MAEHRNKVGHLDVMLACTNFDTLAGRQTSYCDANLSKSKPIKCLYCCKMFAKGHFPLNFV